MLNNINVYKHLAKTFSLPSGCECQLYFLITSLHILTFLFSFAYHTHHQQMFSNIDLFPWVKIQITIVWTLSLSSFNPFSSKSFLSFPVVAWELPRNNIQRQKVIISLDEEKWSPWTRNVRSTETPLSAATQQRSYSILQTLGAAINWHCRP